MTQVAGAPPARRHVIASLAGLAILGFVVVLVAGLAQLAAGPGARFGYWPFGTGFRIIEYAAWAAAIGAGIALVGAVLAVPAHRTRLLVLGLAGAVIGAGLAYWPSAYRAAFRAPPPLYDVTTDTENPPAFVAGATLRQAAQARLPLDYPRTFAAEQRKAYPQIQTVVSPMSPAEAFNKALTAARALGWTLHDLSPAEGRIEAVAETFWFGFKDDVVIRITAEGDGSRIDVRSTGRIGRRDGGANARRVIAFLEKMKG